MVNNKISVQYGNVIVRGLNKVDISCGILLSQWVLVVESHVGPTLGLPGWSGPYKKRSVTRKRCFYWLVLKTIFYQEQKECATRRDLLDSYLCSAIGTRMKIFLIEINLYWSPKTMKCIMYKVGKVRLENL